LISACDRICDQTRNYIRENRKLFSTDDNLISIEKCLFCNIELDRLQNVPGGKCPKCATTFMNIFYGFSLVVNLPKSRFLIYLTKEYWYFKTSEYTSQYDISIVSPL